MKLLPEFALIHDIFEGSPNEVRFAVAYLYKTLLSDGLVRNLHGGTWERMLRERARDTTLDWSVRKLIIELLKALSKRLLLYPACTSTPPESAIDWCQEALASHRADPLDAIIAGTATTQACGGGTVCSLYELPDRSGDLRPAPSLPVRHQTADYLRHLHELLTHARHVCFIDPYIGESSNYSEFPKIILSMRNRPSQPQIELHRAQKYGGEVIRKESDWRRKFRDWDKQFSSAGQRVKMFIWGKFHNRYLLSDLVSLQVGGGFHTSNDVSAVDHWTRLSREDAIDLQGKFGENSSDQLACLICDPFFIGTK
jgi:hypothetical protein